MRYISPISDPTLEHQIGPRGTFSLRVASGEVSVRGTEGDRVRVGVDDQDAFAREFSVEARDGSLEIRQREKIGFNLFGRGNSVDFEIEVPHGAGVSVETASGDVEALDLDGDKRFRTASGEITLHRLAGPVDVETVSGDVDLEGQAPVDLRIRSVSGDVKVRVPRLRRLDLGTTSGDMWLDAELGGDGPYALRSISGDATIVGRSGFRVEAESITGDLSSELPSKRDSSPGRRIMIVGRPGATLAFRSVSGDLRVVQPREAAPAMAPEAPSAPDAPRPPAPPASPAPPKAPAADVDTARLDILRELERGEISVADATERLAHLDEVSR
ncbi:MAG TPA: DUF4097 family beta strand repeat-containing protein [Candidatus Limnocylindrales bacterium]|nr:DUF4097 family beta strand repeat-containing protein [Candidatus Limnocylindrales bacterium]